MRFIPVSAALLVVAIAGCASAPPAPAAKVAAADNGPPPKQVCHKEMPTGSQIPVTVCEAEMTDAERANHNMEIENTIRAQTQQHTIGH
jgi:type IV pilus biogenesis protein CpaD/CtpE